MSSPANFMDCPDWTPEQRTAVALVETLRIKRSEDEQTRAARLYARNFSTLTAAPALPPVAHPWSVLWSALFQPPRAADR
jgi:hypothetical protein